MSNENLKARIYVKTHQRSDKSWNASDQSSSESI